MDIQKIVLDILVFFKEGDNLLQQAQYASAGSNYIEAMRLLRSLPETEPFDRLGFGASCLDGLSIVNIQMHNYETALRTADSDLRFFDSVLPQNLLDFLPELPTLGGQKPTKTGHMYPAEYPKWILAILSKGIALASLGRCVEAVDQKNRAAEMLHAPLAQSPAVRNFQKRINECIEKLDDLLKKDS